MKRVLCVLAKTKSGDVDSHLFLVDAEVNMFTAKEKLEALAKNLVVEYSESNFGMEVIINNGGFLEWTDILNRFKHHKKRMKEFNFYIFEPNKEHLITDIPILISYDADEYILEI